MVIQLPMSFVASTNLLGIGLDPGSMALLGMAIIGLTLLMRLTARRLMKSRNSPPSVPTESLRKTERLKHAQQTLEQTMLELDDLSRQIHGQLDTKLARLETLIRDADRRIERLARMKGGVEGSASLDILLPQEIPQGLVSEAAAPDTDLQTDQSEAKTRDGQQTRILALADEGLGSGEIADKTGIHVGEVELILGLHHARDRVATTSGSKAG